MNIRTAGQANIEQKDNPLAPTDNELIRSRNAYLKSVTHIHTDLPFLEEALNTRICIFGLSEGNKKALMQRWLVANRLQLLNQLKALKRVRVTHQDLESITDEILNQIGSELLALNDEYIKQRLKANIQDFCNKHKYRGCILQLDHYQERANEFFKKYRASELALSQSKYAWNEMQNIVYRSRSYREWGNDLLNKGPLLLIGGSLLYTAYLAWTDPQANKFSIQFYLNFIRKNIDLVFQHAFIGSLQCYTMFGGSSMPKMTSDSLYLENALQQGLVSYIQHRPPREVVEYKYADIIRLLPQPTPQFPEEVVKDKSLKRKNQPQLPAPAEDEAIERKEFKDIEVADTKNIYIALTNGSYARYNVDDFNKLPNAPEDKATADRLIERVKTKLIRTRNIPPPESTETNGPRAPFKGMQGKLRIEASDFRVAFHKREATEAEKALEIEEVFSPRKFVQHRHYNR